MMFVGSQQKKALQGANGPQQEQQEMQRTLQQNAQIIGSLKASIRHANHGSIGIIVNVTNTVANQTARRTAK